MGRITVIFPDGTKREVDAPAGTLLADVIGREKLDMPCGGAGRCGKCLVKAAGRLQTLGAGTPHTRAGEQSSEAGPQFFGGELPGAGWQFPGRELPGAGWQFPGRELPETGLQSSGRELPGEFQDVLACRTRVMGDAEVHVTGQAAAPVIRGAGVMPAFIPDPIFRHYGAAIDVGTTTLAAGLYDRDGSLLAEETAANPQRIFGADVISRIGKSLEGEREQLARLVRKEIDRMILSMSEEAGIRPVEIDAAVITGNTAMLYLLTARDPDCLAHAPFVADELFGRYARPGEIALSSIPSAGIYLPRCISAYVGADITTALLAGRIREGFAGEQPSEEIGEEVGTASTDQDCEGSLLTLMADIGTNGEIALWDGRRLRCCSTAAGPVFEGAGISHGMQGRPGAIDHVEWKDGRVLCHVIGDEDAVGICGSGILDAAAVMCEQEIIDETGYMEEEAFALTPEVSVSRKDIRMVQLAKSAICAGIRTLLAEAGREPEEVRRLAIAGGFGSFLDLGNAARIGLYPPELQGKAEILGNAALSGAAMILLNRQFLEASSELAGGAETVELSTSRVFKDYYMECMEF